MGTHDVPAFIDFILSKTGRSSIDGYVAHSCGTTQFFIGGSMMPSYYRKKVDLFVALAPVVRGDHMSNNLTAIVAPLWPVLSDLLEFIHWYDLSDQSQLYGTLHSTFCMYM